MKLKSFFLILLFGASISFSGCSDDDANTSRVLLKLIDASGDYKEVNIDLIDILVNSHSDEEGWTSLEKVNTGIYDLIKLTGGKEALLADVELPSGYLNQIRLVLGTENSVRLNDDDDNDENDVFVSLKTPSAQQSGLKLNVHTELVAGVTYIFILDWDADRSIIKSGNSVNYILKPVIKVAAEATSGAIHGRVADIEETVENAEPMHVDGAMVSVYDDSDTLFSTTYTNAQGIFVMHGLPEGAYTLKVENAGYDDSDLAGPVKLPLERPPMLERF